MALSSPPIDAAESAEAVHTRLQQEHAQLIEENQRLVTENTKLKRESLKDELKLNLETVLLALCKAPNNDDAISDMTGLSKDMVTYCLNELRGKGLAALYMQPWEPMYCYITPEGRKFLAENGLLT
jgi:hypothetical protein